MPTAAAFVKAVASEAGVGQADARKVLRAPNSVVVREVLAKGVARIPNLVGLRRKVVKARVAGVRKAFGKEILVGPRPSRIKVVASPTKQLKDLLNPR